MRCIDFTRAVRVLWGAAAVLAGLSVAAHAMSYDLVPIQTRECSPDCPRAIVATGEIGRDEVRTFTGFLQSAGQRARVGRVMFIHSPGGNLAGAMGVGALLRQEGFSVVVARAGEGPEGPRLLAGACFSACVHVLAGGRVRLVPDASRIGVHATAAYQRGLFGTRQRIETSDDAIESIDLQQAGYFRVMGIDPRIVSIARSTSHDNIRILSSREIRGLRLARVEIASPKGTSDTRRGGRKRRS